MMTRTAPVWRRTGCALAIGLALTLGTLGFAQPQPGTPEPARRPAPRRPNIIFILADDLGYGDLGCYGQTRIQTPNLDRLASEGMRFTDFYAGSTVCAPSRCTLMTGLDTGHARIRGNANVPLAAGDDTIATILKASGYRTGLIGKWGLGDENTDGVPQKQGFEEFLGYLDQTHAHDYYTDHLWRYDPRARDYTGTNQMLLQDAAIAKGRAPMMFLENQADQKRTYMPDLFTRAALNFVDINRPRDWNHRRPFFLYLATTIPHANNEEFHRSGNGMQVPSDAPYSNEPWPQTEKNKAAMITRLDYDVGRLLDKLKELKLDEDTIIFFSSDNGPHKEGGVDPKFFKSSGPLRGFKRDLYEGGIRVPMIVRWPGHIKPNQVSNGAFAFWDFLPTAAEIAGEKIPAGLEGISFLPTLMGKTQKQRHAFLYWEFHERGFQQAVRMDHWKAVRPQAGQPLELYDLSADPGETRNVAAENPKVIAAIEDHLKTARTDSPQWPIRQPEQKSAGL